MENPFYQKPEKNEREPRTNIHVEIQTTAWYRPPDGKEEVSIRACIADISEKGARFITSREEIPVDAEIRATFQLPGLENALPVTSLGKANRTKHLEGGKWGTGVEFTEVSETSRRLIRSFVSLRQLGETF